MTILSFRRVANTHARARAFYTSLGPVNSAAKRKQMSRNEPFFAFEGSASSHLSTHRHGAAVLYALSPEADWHA